MAQLTAAQKAKIAYLALDDKKAEDVRIISLTGISTLADYFLIASGNNVNHVQAMVDEVEEKLGRAGYEARIEGYQTAGWILMDFGDIVVHVFSKDDRLFYDLERIWRDGKSISPEDLQ
ncbi:MAG: ribosome silencing factor [Lachnospiraceae bacterium]|nr:ribosome silencing factor [Lachnospiraceae bacterium]